MKDHPLDPLSKNEIHLAASVVRSKATLDHSGWFETITLHEPDKSLLNDPDVDVSRSAREFSRCAYVCCYEPSSNRTWQGLVCLDSEAVLAWEHVPGVQARIVAEEFSAADRLVKADTRFREACALRGICLLYTSPSPRHS